MTHTLEELRAARDAMNDEGLLRHISEEDEATIRSVLEAAISKMETTTKVDPREVGLDPVKIQRQRERDKEALDTILSTAKSQLQQSSAVDDTGLKPCPFNQGTPLKKHSNFGWFVSVVVPHDLYETDEVYRTPYFQTEKELFIFWNTRADLATVNAQLLEALRLCKDLIDPFDTPDEYLDMINKAIEAAEKTEV